MVFTAVTGRPDWIPSLRPPQAAGVRGKLTCNGEPAADILVKLYDKDKRFSKKSFAPRPLFFFIMPASDDDVVPGKRLFELG
ncbi:hypothetical protein AAVH_35906 [Aphelenchoides avenae]|nr:hypothetical protein AAVH_35906 [Aphelenchus avenae]